MAVPQVAIIGRPNVGKSSLFNWLARRRIAIVDPTAGVTRDRLASLIRTGDRFFELVDTGGIGIVDTDNLTGEIEKQIDRAIEEAAVILFVVDVRAGLMALDEEVARRLRYVTKPIILVANKCDSPEWDSQAAEFYKLGRGKLICVSAQQGRNRKELLAMIHERLPAGAEAPAPAVGEALEIAIVGRRNTGKSTFINALAQQERVIVSEIPGTTRDSIDVRFERDGKVFVAIDTAGVRRKGSIASDIEFYSMARAERTIRRAGVVLLLLDATAEVSKVDKQLAGYILDHHKPAIFVVNKWDLMLPTPTGKMGQYLRSVFPSLDYVPIAFITAKSGKNVYAVLNLAQNLYKQASARVSTGELNKVLRQALDAKPPPLRQNRRPKVFYATQVATNPPTIVLFTNGPELFDNTYQRYLLRTFRDHLPFHDVPIKLYLRHKRREERPPGEEAGRETKVDLSRLKFKTTVTDEELERDRKQYESDLWKDL
ncbi:MAG: ribosome biogenesis GTPase Der [Gemmataceae bacterium]|nr:ribosome biogenesis GTPase Der [Gemmataceae bacterium]